MYEMTVGDRKPDLKITISDDENNATFGSLSVSALRVVGELDGVIVVDGQPDSYTAAPDGKSGTLQRAWGVSETDQEGRMWISVVATWPSGETQTFVGNPALFIDFRHQPGSA